MLWLADELNLEYDRVEAGGRFGGNQSTSFLAMNPHGKVPVLQDGSNVVWESNTILRYLADAYGDAKWISTDPYTRTLVDRWLDWSIDRLEPAFVGVFWGYYRTPVEHRIQADIDSAVLRCEDCLIRLGGQLGGQPYLNGDEPTIADIATGVFLYRLVEIDLPVTLPDNVCAWYSRLAGRSGYRRQVMSDFSELYGRIEY